MFEEGRELSCLVLVGGARGFGSDDGLFGGVKLSILPDQHPYTYLSTSRHRHIPCTRDAASWLLVASYRSRGPEVAVQSGQLTSWKWSASSFRYADANLRACLRLPSALRFSV
ncbi:uncharacterized protein BO72DRAFT_186930 [Aspergillus fijiensis CBS 313.89]|uniref:Uncharacterized protein n=1 Tax=Aspergillus fijiensis CBS 313.89 TaxID=1448319 RepID=A0A8G1RKS9_9EURO|nr:uncharacterized protein BO72DRAFT_186930 [Aspergillus fijiensis CBS 313.89]RAK75084.1 hypothetical protein BO72DRAFT_186930 [Aspergillus fijiensis CBS 313.89]